MTRERHFLGWDRPVLHLAAEFLTRDWTSGLLDLSDQLVVVPTRHAGRRLRERLATTAAQSHSGVLPPTVVQPEFLVSAPTHQPDVATRADALALFTRILQDTDLAELPALFPVGLSAGLSGFRAALQVADQVCDLRDLLGEAGLSCADVPARLQQAFGDAPTWEPERWQDLIRLETLYLKRLEQAGLRDMNRAQTDGAAAPTLPAHISRVVLLALPDPLPLALTALTQLAERMPVDVCIHAPEDQSDRFDDWGRPLASDWVEQPITLRDEHILLAGKPDDQARHVGNLLDTGVAASELAVGVPDAEVIPYLEHELGERRLTTYNPAGKPVASHVLFHIVEQLGLLLRDDSYEALSALLHIPDLSAYLAESWPAQTFDTTALLTQLDQLQNQHLPATYSALRTRAQANADRMPELCWAIKKTDECLQPLRVSPVAEQLLTVLEGVYAPRHLQASVEADDEFTSVANRFSEYLTQGHRLVHGLVSTPAEQMDLLLHVLRNASFYPDVGAEKRDVTLEGWLELHWDDAPVLVLTGFNEGMVPNSVVGHAYLPDSARAPLGLLHNHQRFARDVYLLNAMLASRTQSPGAVRVIVGKTTNQGDVRKPSRLLFQCADDLLPSRAKRLFGDVREQTTMLPWQRGWRLAPTRPAPPEYIHVTAFRDYLSCPFRFYLKHIVGMQPLDDRKTELDAADFGNICHAALEQFGRDPSMRDAVEPDVIAGYLTAQAERAVNEHYGPVLSTAVLIQLDAIRQRLHAAAHTQAGLREQGWRIYAVEIRLADCSKGIEWGGIYVRGKIDRIDINEQGRFRIIDYKTSDSLTTPFEAHVASLRPDTPDYARVTVGGRERRWNDLQLPLYCVLLRDQLGQEAECAYFSLPKAATQTRVDPWPFEPGMLATAAACARNVVERLKEGIFWPPAEKVKYDDFEQLFFNGTAASVNW